MYPDRRNRTFGMGYLFLDFEYLDRVHNSHHNLISSSFEHWHLPSYSFSAHQDPLPLLDTRVPQVVTSLRMCETGSRTKLMKSR